MKTNEKKDLHNKSVEELKKLLKDNRNDLFTARLEHTRGKLKNARTITAFSRNIAIIATILRGKELDHVKND